MSTNTTSPSGTDRPRRKAKAEAAGEEIVAELKKGALIDQVVEKSGVKKKDAKPAVEAVLAILGEAIAAGQGLNLPPLGKLKVTRSEDKPNGKVIVCKLRQSNGSDEGKDPLAEAED